MGEGFGGRNDATTMRLDVHEFAFHQMKDNVDVMYHEIVDDTGFSGAQGIGVDPIALDKGRLPDLSQGGAYDGVESFNMPHLKSRSELVSDVTKSLGVFQSVRQRLFDENSLARLEKRLCRLTVKWSGSYDADRVDFVDQGIGIIKGCAAIEGCDLPTPVSVSIKDPHQFGIRDFIPVSGMSTAQMTDTDYCNLQGTSYG